MPRLGRYRFSFDTWKILEADDLYLEESEEIGSLEVETRDWRPIDGTPADSIRIAFVDGVRRTENLVYLEGDDGTVSKGAFVSIGVGALLLSLGRPNPAEDAYRNLKVRRFLFVEKGTDLGRRSLSFRFGDVSLDFFVEETDGEISPHVNEVMAKLEAGVAEEVFKEEKPDLMITDGTLHYTAKIKNLPFVGYVKKHRKIYMYPENTCILREMRVGQRTPLILIHSQPTMEGEGAKTFDKLTWYVKISESEGLSGIARLEVPAGIGVKRAVEIANLTAWLIPKFASAEFSDRRAPQNLVPVKYLENTLRHRIGSQTLIRKIIMDQMFKL
ncbi:MAG: DNA double-strand break repair nuclease NurA [Aquificota bacterium]|nr:DNA double-strand break repair nuclease NurA [Aquificota bacterium]